jgi:DHA2 family multidrug resistance protein
MAIWATGVMVGPILGPTLGGWLTDAYNWRWVFFINVPFGIAAIAGVFLFLKERHRDVTLRFDWLGFLALSLGLGAIQLMLDRGSSKDWFSSSEIVIEAVLGGLGFYVFLVHMFTAEKPFIPPRLFKDAGFLSGFVTMFVVGIILLASSALLPPYLQNLGGYSVTQVGFLMAPRGVGAMVVMIIAGRMTKFVDPRLLIGVGVLLMAASMWDMTGWTPEIDMWHFSIITIILGMGISFIFIPLQSVGFATLEPSLRTDAAALFSLSRNIGSAFGVSVTSSFLASSTQALHAQYAEQITPFNRALQTGAQGLFLDPVTPFGAAGIDAQVQYHALVSAYANDFMLMFWVCLPLLPLLFFMRKPKAAAPRPSAAEMAME